MSNIKVNDRKQADLAVPVLTQNVNVAEMLFHGVLIPHPQITSEVSSNKPNGSNLSDMMKCIPMLRFMLTMLCL